MPSYPIRDFARGISDHYMSGQGSQRLDNLVLDAVGNPLQRGGQVNWSARIPANQKITDLHYSQRTPRTLFAHSAGNIYWDTPIFSWQTLTGDNGTKPGYGADTTYRAIFQGNGPFTYVHFWTTSYDNGGTYLTHPKPKKILDPGIPGSSTVNLGLPKPASPSISAGTNTIGGAGGYSYLYYAVYKYTYTYNDVTYIERSAPSEPTLIEFDFAISGARTASISSSSVDTDTIYTPAQQNYPDPADVRVEIYRTKENETVPYLLPTNAPYSSMPQSDVATDIYTDADISGNTELYTTDGTSPFDEPPACRFFHVVNDIAYYGGFFLNSGYDYEVTVLQSVPGVPTSAPADNEIRCPEPLTGGISSADVYPIFLCKGSLWRLEGSIDSFGAGVTSFHLISDQVGCQLPYTVKKYERTVFFVGTDGHHYETDGFTLKKLTDHVSRQIVTRPDDTQSTVVGDVALEPKTGRLLVSYASTGSDQDTIFVGDQRHPVGGGIAYTTLSGRDHETLGKIFTACSMIFIEPNLLYLGTRHGYVMRLSLEPVPSSTTNYQTPDDVMPDTATTINLWKETAVVPDWISAAQHYGYPSTTKITTGVTATFHLPVSQTTLTAEIFSYREGKYRTEAVKAEENACAVIRETALSAAQQTYEAFRRLRKQGLRATLRQFRVRKGFVVSYASDPDDVNAYPQATTSAGGKTAQLVGGTWPTDIVNSYLYLSATGYARGFLITAVSGDTVTVRDTAGTWPSGVFYWQIKTYPLDQWVQPLGLEVEFFPLGTQENVPTAAKAGENVVRP